MAQIYYMDAVIAPRRSLSRQGFYWVIGVIAAFNLASASLFIALRAFPVPIFLGLDVLAVVLAFRVNYRGAALAERVQISAEQVRVSHQYGARARTVWTSPTAFTGVSVEGQGEHEVRVRLHMSGRTVIIGAALSPGERADLAVRVEAAIKAARAERY